VYRCACVRNVHCVYGDIGVLGVCEAWFNQSKTVRDFDEQGSTTKSVSPRGERRNLHITFHAHTRKHTEYANNAMNTKRNERTVYCIGGDIYVNRMDIRMYGSSPSTLSAHFQNVRPLQVCKSVLSEPVP
jgi:hypothetical protein